MKSKILLCVILASCSTMQVSEDKVKDRYTDVVKSTDWMKTSNGIQPILGKENVYLCDYGYIESRNKKDYRRFCDKDGKLLNDYIETSADYGFVKNYKKYLLTDGKISYYEGEYIRPDDILYSYYFIDHDDIAAYSSKGGYEKLYCDNNDIIEENWKYSDRYIRSYNKVKKDGVAIDENLIMVKGKNGEYFYKIGNERQMKGHFEVLDCQGKVKLSFTLLNGKYDGEKVGDDNLNFGGGSVIKKIYKSGELVSKSLDCLGKQTSYGITYDKWESVKNGDKWNYKYYLKDKLVKEVDYDEDPFYYY